MMKAIKLSRLTKYGILWRNISNLRQKIDDFAKFLRYGLWLNLTGKRNTVSYTHLTLPTKA